MKKLQITIFIVAFLACMSVNATLTRVFDTNGQLIGANGVNVDGTLYSVEFLDGTCIVLFDGCNEPSDFVFMDEAAASAAANVLSDELLLDELTTLLDSDPSLTRGCGTSSFCGILIPFREEAGRVFSMRFNNAQFDAQDTFIGPIAFTGRLSTFAVRDDTLTWARFVVQSETVSEPPLFALLALACASMGWCMRRST